MQINNGPTKKITLRITVSLPKQLVAELRAQAAEEGRSLSGQIAWLLSHSHWKGGGPWA